MLATPEIIAIPARPAAVIRLTVPRSAIREVMGAGLAELRAALAAQGLAASGPWFTHHLRMDPDVFNFEIGLPVEDAVASSGRVTPGELPAATVARAVYLGPYEGLGAAWGELGAWVAAEGLTPRQGLWESYLAGPESGPDPTTWRTELNRPLVRPA